MQHCRHLFDRWDVVFVLAGFNSEVADQPLITNLRERDDHLPRLTRQTNQRDVFIHLRFRSDLRVGTIANGLLCQSHQVFVGQRSQQRTEFGIGHP